MRHLPLLVLALLTVSITLQAQGVLYEEKFTDGTLDNVWFPGFNGNTMEAVNYPGNPSGDGWVGMLGNHFSGGNVGQSYSGSPDMGDYYYEAQVYIPVDEAVYYGLEFRLDTTGLTSGYQFVARFKPGGMTTERLRFRVRPTNNPGMPAVIKDWEAIDIPGGIPQQSGWHRMAVLAKGHQFWFWFDGEELPGCPVMDFTSLKGAIGAYIWDAASPLYNLYIDDINVTPDVVASARDAAPVPAQPVLHQNYPNPVTGGSTVMLDLPARMHTRLEVFTLQGQKVALLAEGMLDAGRHTYGWNAGSVAAGSYVLRLTTSQGVQERHCVVLR